MSTTPQTLSEVRALAEQSLGDPESSQHFLLALGVTPEAFAALDEQAQAKHLQQLQAGEQSLQGNVQGATQKDVKNATKRYALASQDAEAGLVWSVGGVWSASLLSQAPDLMTGPEVDAFHKGHPNAQVVDVLVYLEAHKAYIAGFNSVLDPNERSTPESRKSARDAGIKSLVRAGFAADALEIGRKEILGPGKVSNHSDQAAQAELLGRNQTAIAEWAFEAYNFGEGVAVTGASGWEYYAAGHERSRAVYVEIANDDGKEKSTTQLGFTVRFDPQTGALAEAYASDYKDQIWGSLPQGNVTKSGMTTDEFYSTLPAVERPVFDQSVGGFVIHAHPEIGVYPRSYEHCVQAFARSKGVALVDDEHVSPKDQGKVEARLSLSDLYAKWDALGDVPIDDEDCIEEVFSDFGVGTHREEIWRWFERQHPLFIVGDVMQGIRHQDDGKVQLLQSYGYFAGARDPKVKPDFTGRFMVRDTEDDADGFCIVGDDLGALVNEALEHLDIAPERKKGNVKEAIPAPVSPDLSKLDDYALISELQRRGMVVQAWSSDDFEFIGNEDEEVIELDLSDEALEKVQQQAFEQARRDLGGIVTARGNQHLADWWAMNKEPILAQFKVKTVDDSPSPGM